MKAGKENKGPQIIELNGKVVQKKFGKGSKSAHDAIMFETDKGSFVLRRVGGNPFSDPVLQKWIGKKITASGFVEQYTFMAQEIKPI